MYAWWVGIDEAERRVMSAGCWGVKEVRAAIKGLSQRTYGLANFTPQYIVHEDGSPCSYTTCCILTKSGLTFYTFYLVDAHIWELHVGGKWWRTFWCKEVRIASTLLRNWRAAFILYSPSWWGHVLCCCRCINSLFHVKSERSFRMIQVLSTSMKAGWIDCSVRCCFTWDCG